MQQPCTDAATALLEGVFFPIPPDLASPPSCFRFFPELGSWDCWCPPTFDDTDIQAAVTAGRGLADDLVGCAKDNQRPDLIAHVVNVVIGRITKGALRFGFVEVGLMQRLCDLSFCAAHN